MSVVTCWLRCHDSFVRVAWLIHIWNIIRLCVHVCTCIYVILDAHLERRRVTTNVTLETRRVTIHVTRISRRGVSHAACSAGCQNSFVRVTSFILDAHLETRQVTTYVTLGTQRVVTNTRISRCGVSRAAFSVGCHNSFVRVTWVIHTCDMAYFFVYMYMWS